MKSNALSQLIQQYEPRLSPRATDRMVGEMKTGILFGGKPEPKNATQVQTWMQDYMQKAKAEYTRHRVPGMDHVDLINEAADELAFEAAAS